MDGWKYIHCTCAHSYKKVVVHSFTAYSLSSPWRPPPSLVAGPRAGAGGPAAAAWPVGRYGAPAGARGGSGSSSSATSSSGGPRLRCRQGAPPAGWGDRWVDTPSPSPFLPAANFQLCMRLDEREGSIRGYIDLWLGWQIDR